MKNKAINFLEYVQNLKNKYKEADWDSYENCNTAKDIIFKATEFYNQPFSPDLIEKCFEGATNGKYNGYVYYGKQGEFHFDEIHTYYHILTYNSAPPKQVMLPVTLDQFISDCQRAEIDLIFSPYSLSQLNLEK